MALLFPPGGSTCGTLVGIDPGTNYLGLSAIEVDLSDLRILRVHPHSFRSDHLLPCDRVITESHTERTEKILAQQANLLDYFRFYQPFAICSESPFYSPLMPGAYAALVEVVAAIRNAAMAYSMYVPFYTYEPSIVKKAIGAHATRGNKDAMRDALRALTEISDVLSIPVDRLDEHAIDASAVGYAHLQFLRG